MSSPSLLELVTEVLAGERRAAGWQVAEWQAAEAQAHARAVYPGSFAPRHEGHRAIADHARRRGLRLAHEISLTNVDKRPLSAEAAIDRARQFSGEPLWFTAAPRFAEKAALFPGAQFLVGLDTLQRIADLRYYRGDDERQRTIDTLAEQKCRLLVYGRCDQQGKFQTLPNLDLPPALRALCQSVPESEFRMDRSSTELRERS